MNIFPRKASRRATGTLHIATALLAVIITLATGAQAAQTTSWIGTWTASPQPTWEANFVLPTNTPASLFNQTVWQIALVSLGGRRIRIVLSNEYGIRPLASVTISLFMPGKTSTGTLAIKATRPWPMP